MSDHSPVFISVNHQSEFTRGRYGWNFNTSLLQDKNFSSEMKSYFESLKNDLNTLANPHLNNFLLLPKCQNMDFLKALRTVLHFLSNEWFLSKCVMHK